MAGHIGAIVPCPIKQGEFLHKLAYCQQAGGWQFEH
jgi:hypothetical protein